LQILKEPRLYHETEDVHLLDTFLFSTKMNEAEFRISQSLGDRLAQDAIGKDIYAIPERIFKPIDEGRGGHTEYGTKEQEYEDIRKNSLGKIVSVKRYEYNDGTGDYYYHGKVKLNGSKAASVLIENGSKTWIPFAVSPHIWPLLGPDNNISDAEFMGLGLVIQGAYGKQAVVNKYCSGSATVCQKSLAGAIQDVINSFNTNNDSLNIMSAQVQELPTVKENVSPIQTPQVIEENKLSKDITLTKEEYDKLQEQVKAQEELRNEVSNLRNEYKTNVLNQIFGNITDENIKDNLTKKYFEKDVKLVKEIYEDITAQILPMKIEEAIKKSQEESSKDTVKSKTASSLKPEPKKEKVTEESKTASVNDEPTVNELFGVMGL